MLLFFPTGFYGFDEVSRCFLTFFTMILMENWWLFGRTIIEKKTRIAR